MLFNFDPPVASASQFRSLRTGLANWKATWFQRCLNDDERFFDSEVTRFARRKDHGYCDQTHVISANETNMWWRQTGFWRHAPEFWLLAKVMLDQKTSKEHLKISGMFKLFSKSL